MNLRLFCVFLSIIFISFIPRQFNSNLDDYKKYKNIADSIFLANQNLDSFSFQKIYFDSIIDQSKVAIMVGKIFSPKEKNAIVIYSTSDSTIDLNLFELKESKWSLLQRQSIACGSSGPAEEFVFFEPINDDKTKGLLILTNVWLIRSGVNFKAFLFKKNKLTEVKGFDEYPNPIYDCNTKKVYSYMGTGCADMTMGFMEGIIQNDSLVKQTDIGCDCCSDTEKTDSCTIYINNKEPFKVQYDSAYKYVQPFYQNFLKNKLEQIKDN